MEVTVLAMAGCPNAPLLEQRLAEAIGCRPGITVRRIVIPSLTAAARHGMHGSPTLLINGTDPFALPGTQPALACRLFRGDDGRPARAPSVTALRQALTRTSELAGSRPATGASAAPRTRRSRGIGPAGTAARLGTGLFLLGSVLAGELTRGFHPAAWLLGLAGLPVTLLTAAWLRARWFPASLRATGPAGHLVNLAIIAALYATPWYAPPLRFTSDAALLFYGMSLLLAAIRGYGGCEVLAVPNWLLRRSDQAGCVFFWPIDALERRPGPAMAPPSRPARPGRGGPASAR